MSVNIVFYQPEIAENTGNIMRTCVATNTILHLIEPLGFSLLESKLKRSGVNYIKDLKYFRYKNFEDFLSKNKGEFYFLTRYGQHHLFEVNVSDVNKDYYFVIGKESTGIPKEILQDNLDRCIRLPMTDKVRALNVSNVAAIMIYEAMRQQNYPDLELLEPQCFKGSNYLEK